jgi:hypothetical protein
MTDETRAAIAGIVMMVVIGTAIFIFEVAKMTIRELRRRR